MCDSCKFNYNVIGQYLLDVCGWCSVKKKGIFLSFSKKKTNQYRPLHPDHQRAGEWLMQMVILSWLSEIV